MIKEGWYPFNEGLTIGTTGSESGVILLDEEYAQETRITLEQGQRQPFAITCGIYGWMVHTIFAASRDEALEKFEAMKKRLVEICELIPFLDDPEVEEKCRIVSRSLQAFIREF